MLETLLRGNPRQFARVALIVGIAAVVLIVANCLKSHQVATTSNTAAPGEYLFCFWNLENFFDDKADGGSNRADKEYDAWFADHPDMLRLKLDHLSEALIAMNGGRGPDIFAVAECESERAAELLRDALNARLKDDADHYTHILFKDPKGGRHIATAIITRLPVVADRTKLLGNRQRILVGHIQANGHELVVIASHWTSRLTEKEGEERHGHGREDYADKIYGEFRAMWTSNHAVDVLICGDFNDTPDGTSVKDDLHAGSHIDAVRANSEPILLDIFADKDANRFGTHYHNRWFIFDHIVVSPGLLDDQGWTCDVGSVATVHTPPRSNDRLGRPWSFGSPTHPQRGYSDHFPVTVKLRVQ
jgi:endonuclease/exonuclease/phosphatase family metal-dependent hydrolase